jgi:hypothetical protein
MRSSVIASSVARSDRPTASLAYRPDPGAPAGARDGDAVLGVPPPISGTIVRVLAGLTVGGPFMLVGVLLMAWGWRYLRLDRAIARWPRTRGVMLESGIDSVSGTHRDERGYDVRSTQHTLRVRYEYDVGGQRFEGTQVQRTGWATDDVNEASEMLARYRPGEGIDVLFDPRAPANAYLRSSMSGGAIFLMVFGGFFLFVPLLVFAIVFVATR